MNKNILKILEGSPFAAKSEIADFGFIIYLFHKDEFSSGAIYWYYDDPLTVYLSSLYVVDGKRNMGIGTLTFQYLEKIALCVRPDCIRLLVQKLSWRNEWYKRFGYCDFLESEEENMMWMKKEIKNEKIQNHTR